jgi:electron transport complex protein RnfE
MTDIVTDTVKGQALHETASASSLQEYRELTRQGLWKNNPALVQLLGLCPLLAVTATVTNALGLGFATMLVLMGSNLTVSLVRQWVPKEIRIPVFVMVIATFVTLVQLSMNAYVYGLYQALGIFIPLIVTNCVIIGRAEAYASKNPWQKALFDGFIMGLGFTLVLVLLGGVREIIGNGTLFDGAKLLLGDWATVLRLEVLQFDFPLLLAILPPGAFIAMGFIIALKNAIDQHNASRAVKPVKEVTRARVTAQ